MCRASPPRAGRTGPCGLLGSVWMTEISRPLRLAEAVGALSLAPSRHLYPRRMGAARMPVEDPTGSA
jgi:hypothetical protein